MRFRARDAWNWRAPSPRSTSASWPASTLGKICDQGHDVSLSDGPELIDDYATPVFKQMAEELGGDDDDSAEHVAGKYKVLADEAFAMASTKCGSELPKNGSICEDHDKTVSFGKCVQKGGVATSPA